jgi:hypothetical protein
MLALVAGVPIPLATIFLSATRGHQSRKEELELEKVRLFLNELARAEKDEFINKLRSEGKIEEWGNNILLLLGQMDHMDKPRIVGRIFRACVEWHIDYKKAMRLAAIVNRCYATDIEYLKIFRPGVLGPGDEADIVAMLFSAGLLVDLGPLTRGSTAYDLNDYGRLLLQYGL